jgi:hypothetical protein
MIRSIGFGLHGHTLLVLFFLMIACQIGSAIAGWTTNLSTLFLELFCAEPKVYHTG